MVFLLLLLLETVADQQQWKFQSTKRRRSIEGERLEGEFADGFCQSGLFAVSRHPNFFAEYSLWWSFYLFSVTSTYSHLEQFGGLGRLVNWTVVGALTLTLLFQGSTDLTEKLSLRKYPRYRDYQGRVSKLTPWFRAGVKTVGWRVRETSSQVDRERGLSWC